MADVIHSFQITAEEASALFSAHDGDMALVYLYCSATGCSDPEQLAAALFRTTGEITAAMEKLSRLLPQFEAGSARTVQTQPDQLPAENRKEAQLGPAPELPEYTAEEIAERAQEDASFSAVVQEAQKIYGRHLSTSDLKILFGIYDHLGMAPEVILMMMQHCADRYNAYYAGRRRPNAKAFEREAFLWQEAGVETLEQAEDYIRTLQETTRVLNQLCQAVEIHRTPTKTEKGYLLSWAKMGFGPQALAIAYDRTVTNTGSLKWAYMDKILRSWHEKKLHTAEEIKAGDGLGKTKARPETGATDAAVNEEELRNILNLI